MNIRLRTPDLVDLKITNRCPFEHDCGFCYMGSTTRGQEAVASNIYKIIDVLAEMKIWEIAFGGGEPTLYPDFLSILKYTRSKQIIPNFTTKNPKFDPAMLEPIGAFAFSCHNLNSIKQLDRYPRDKAIVQIVMGIHQKKTFDELVQQAAAMGFPITLLGYKTVGRGQHYKSTDYSWWQDSVKDLEVDIAIDTLLAKQSDLSAIDPVLFHTEEGQTSAYIDAVTMQCGPSSYHPQMYPLATPLYDSLLHSFHSF